MAPASLLVDSQAPESKALKVDWETRRRREGAQAFNLVFLERIKVVHYPSHDPTNTSSSAAWIVGTSGSVGVGPWRGARVSKAHVIRI